jgi:hypothetical protein
MYDRTPLAFPAPGGAGDMLTYLEGNGKSRILSLSAGRPGPKTKGDNPSVLGR